MVKLISPTGPLATGTPQAGAWDIRSNEEVEFWPGRIHAIRTGIFTQLDSDCVAIIKERGGMAMKGFDVKAGVVDADYRGEWMVVMRFNPSVESPDMYGHSNPVVHGLRAAYFEQRMRIKKGDKIAQVLLVPSNTRNILFEMCSSVDQFEPTVRGEGRFGSTGE